MGSNSESQVLTEIPLLKPSLGESQRWSERTDVRPHDGITAELISDNHAIPVRVFDISSTGICLIIDEAKKSYIPEISCFVTLSVKVRNSQKFSAKYKVCWFAVYKDAYRVGLQLELPAVEKKTQGTILNLAPEYPLVGYVLREFHYQEKALVHIIRIGQEVIEIAVDDGSTLFYKDQSVTVHFSPRRAKKGSICGSVVSIVKEDRRSTGVSQLVIRLKVSPIHPVLKRVFVEHLLANSSISLSQIREIGLDVKEIAQNFRFRYVKTQKEYLEVLDLRLKAYHLAGKVMDGAGPETMVAPLDSISRILIALHGDKIIASVALSFPESSETLLDTERALTGGYPSSIPPKVTMIEVARLVTDPDYRQSDLLLRTFQHIYRIFALSGREYLISSCDDKLWPLYKKLGFAKTGLAYPHPYLNGIPHHIITINIKVPTAGVSIDPFRWSILYKGMTAHIEQQMQIERTFINKVRIRAFKLISSLLARWH